MNPWVDETTPDTAANRNRQIQAEATRFRLISTVLTPDGAGGETLVEGNGFSASGLSRSGVGVYALTFDSAFTDADQVAVAVSIQHAAANSYTASWTATTAKVTIYIWDGGAASDAPDGIGVLVFGPA